MQKNDKPVFFTEGIKSSLETHYVIQALHVADGVAVAGERLNGLFRQAPFLDGDKTSARIAAFVIDEVVVENPVEPWAGFAKLDQVIEAGKHPGEHILK